ATMAGAVFLGADINPESIKKRLNTRYIDKMTDSYEQAIGWAKEAIEKKEPISIGLVSDAGDMLARLLENDLIPDILTDQTSAHDPINGYIPNGFSLEEASELRKRDPEAYQNKAIKS